MYSKVGPWVTLMLVTLRIGPNTCLFMPQWPIDDQGTLLPKDPTLLVGDTLRLNCTLIGNFTHLNASHMYITWKSTVLPAKFHHAVSAKTLIYEQPNIQSNQDGTYHCQLNRSSEGKETEYLDSQYVQIGRLPKLPEKLDCMSDSFKHLTCSWCPENVDSFVHYELNWTVNPQKPYMYKCPHEEKSGNCKLCQWKAKDGRLNIYRPFMTYTIMLYGKSTFIKGRPENVSKIIEVKPWLIVKPGKVQNLRTEDIKRRRIIVQWDHPTGLQPDVLPLVYQVHFSSQWGDHQETINTSETIQNLTNLRSFTNYSISVRAKPEEGGFWSSTSNVIAKTESSEPEVAPAVSVNSFRVNCHPYCCDRPTTARNVDVFWKGIPPKQRNGVICGYKIVVTWHSGSRLLEVADPHDNIRSTTLQRLPSDRQHVIHISANNSVGWSPNSTMVIPKDSKMPCLLSTKIIGEYNMENTAANFTWSPPGHSSPMSSDIYVYTMFWCKGDRRNPACTGELQEAEVPPGQLSYRVTVDDGQAEDYVFALAVTRTGRQVYGSGMTWWLCIYKYHGLPRVVDNWVASEQQEERSLTVQWQMKCETSKANNVRIWHYYLQYQEINGTDTGKVIIPGNQMQYKIPNLKPFTWYQVTLTAESRDGKGNTAFLKRQTKQSKPESPEGVTVMNATSMSLYVSWQRPTRPNGIIREYKITVMKTNQEVVKSVLVAGMTEAQEVGGLEGYTRFQVVVTARNDAGESNSSVPASGFTGIREPAQIPKSAVVLRKIGSSNSEVHLSWAPPMPANGPVTEYLIQWGTKEQQPEILNVTGNSTNVVIACEQYGEKTEFEFSVLAVNTDGTRTYKGLPSEPHKEMLCTSSGPFAAWAIVLLAVASSVLLTISAGVFIRKYGKNVKESCFAPIKITTPPNITDNIDVQQLFADAEGHQDPPYARANVEVQQWLAIAEGHQDPPYAQAKVDVKHLFADAKGHQDAQQNVAMRMNRQDSNDSCLGSRMKRQDSTDSGVGSMVDHAERFRNGSATSALDPIQELATTIADEVFNENCHNEQVQMQQLSAKSQARAETEAMSVVTSRTNRNSFNQVASQGHTPEVSAADTASGKTGEEKACNPVAAGHQASPSPNVSPKPDSPFALQLCTQGRSSGRMSCHSTGKDAQTNPASGSPTSPPQNTGSGDQCSTEPPGLFGGSGTSDQCSSPEQVTEYSQLAKKISPADETSSTGTGGYIQDHDKPTHNAKPTPQMQTVTGYLAHEQINVHVLNEATDVPYSLPCSVQSNPLYNEYQFETVEVPATVQAQQTSDYVTETQIPIMNVNNSNNSANRVSCLREGTAAEGLPRAASHVDGTLYQETSEEDLYNPASWNVIFV